jgi:hypothetical protein
MTICIGLCVYKNEFGLPYVFKNIERIQTLFQEKIQIVVAYDESPDCSLGFLISKLSEFDIHILKNVNTTSNSRVENIANARNTILEYIRKNFTETKYLIMMDTNEYACVGDISLDILKEVFESERENEWDAVSFDREAGYYDHWALSFDPFIYSFVHTMNYQKTVEKMREFFGKMLENAKKTPNKFISVFSAFNGFAIYKWPIFKDCKYSSMIDISLFPKELVVKQFEITGVPMISNFSGDCEHRHFHLQAIHDKNARIRIYPKSLFSIFKGDKMKGCRGPC